MSVDVQLPVEQLVAVESPPRRRWRVVMGALALAIVGVLVGGLVWGLNYQPLSSGFLGGVEAPAAEVQSRIWEKCHCDLNQGLSSIWT